MKSKYFLLIPFFILFITFCKKPRSGNYVYEESGVKSTYLKEGATAYTLTDKGNINSSVDARLKNKSNSTLYIDNVPWDINGDSVTNRNNSTTPQGTGSTLKSYYSYRGIITGKKSIEGVFSRIQVYTSYTNVRVDSASGTFKYHKK
ncbi:MAG: hypothetical protein H0U95_16425 [Bacteroidetes bacterium]|nr:hypothetical protein [Bacteroidota bacterium]